MPHRLFSVNVKRREAILAGEPRVFGVRRSALRSLSRARRGLKIPLRYDNDSRS